MFLHLLLHWCARVYAMFKFIIFFVQDKKQFDRQLSELRYAGIRLHNARPLLEVIRDRYIHIISAQRKL